MPKIQLLPDHLVSQIAAGEVVERPASVVKELIENSLDAGSSEITVELEVGGKRMIRIVDDGVGMGKEDALLAFDQHATSKIRDFDDLQRVATLGFRGEALASIAAVAKVELITAEAPGDGWRVRIEGSRVRKVEPMTRARGTTLEIGSLFFNVPARRKFLKQPRTELRRCVEVVQGYCLACPDVSFKLLHEGRRVLDAVGTSVDAEGLRERIRQLFGDALTDALIELSPGGIAGESIRGFVGRRETSKGRRLFVFVNGRLIRDRQVLATYYRSVRDEWKHDEYPSLFLFLGVPPEDLDVNVHPQKSEVRFRDSSFVQRVARTLRAGLLEARGEEEAPLREAWGISEQPLAWRGLGASTSVGPKGNPNSDTSSVGEIQETFSVQPSALWDWRSDRKIAETEYPRPSPKEVPLSRGSRDRSVRILAQYKGALLLLETPRGLVLMDQHAAHERVLYEKLARAMEQEEPSVQRLLVPELLQLGPAERLRLDELVESLEPLGFLLERLSGGDLAVVGVPSVLGDREALEMLLNLAGSVDRSAQDADQLKKSILEAVAAETACRSAIKIHHALPMPQMEELVETLFDCADPYSCPHGRPTLLEMTDSELERRFGRR